MSMAFSGKGSHSAEKKRWIEITGTYRYYSLLLAQFNPKEASKILNSRADEIAQAYVSQMCYSYDPNQGKK